MSTAMPSLERCRWRPRKGRAGMAVGGSGEVPSSASDQSGLPHGTKIIPGAEFRQGAVPPKTFAHGHFP
ncbi:MAG: hypothetical protein AB7V04_06615 [Desulfomonilaceae bacterium]